MDPIFEVEQAPTPAWRRRGSRRCWLTDKVLGADLKANPKLVMAGAGSFETQAIILATGSMGRTQAVAGEKEFLGRGVSYCATCDGVFFRDQPVAVIGSNDEALEETLFLTTHHNIYPEPGSV